MAQAEVQISTDSFTLLGTADFGKVLPEDLTGLPRPRVGQFGVGFAL